MNNKQKMEKIFAKLNQLDLRLSEIEKNPSISPKLNKDAIKCVEFYNKNKVQLKNIAIQNSQWSPYIKISVPCFVDLDTTALFDYDTKEQKFISFKINNHTYKNLLEN